MFDLCIVGAGMVGSAAARHATLTSGLKTCLIGPTEPKKRSSGDNRDIYGSYYDEGRITRCSDQDSVWSFLTKESTRRYRDLEDHSGINFYYEVGSLLIGGKNSAFLKNVEDINTKGKIATEKLNDKSLHQQYPYLKITKATNGILEMKNSGYINPRKLVEAQKIMATKQGCTIIDDIVRRVSRIVQSDGTYIMVVDTESGSSIQSKKVLLATGAFTNFRDLLAGVKPDQNIAPLIVSLIEVGGKDRQILRDMPCVEYRGPKNEIWDVPPSLKSKEISFYMLPPIRYPDGRYYIKLGLRDGNTKPLMSSGDVKKWFDEGNSKIEQDVAKFTVSLFQGVKFNSWKGDSCVKTETPTTRPYIDMIHDQLGVAIGGNGCAAKSSDEIGRLAASMVLAKWDSGLPRDVFKFKTLSHFGITSPKAKL